MMSSKELGAQAQRCALGGKKVPHGVSYPVLRTVEGNVAVCYFVYLSPFESVRSKEYAAPVEWLALDLKTGELIGRYACDEQPFFEEPAGAMYSLSDPTLPKPSRDYYLRTYELFDRICKGCSALGKVDDLLYQLYLDRVLAVTPTAYRTFYRSLSM